MAKYKSFNYVERPFQIGDVVVKFQTDYCLPAPIDLRAQWWTAGIVNKVEHFLGQHYKYEFTVVVLTMKGRRYPKSWVIGTASDFCGCSHSVAKINACRDMDLVGQPELLDHFVANAYENLICEIYE